MFICFFMSVKMTTDEHVHLAILLLPVTAEQ